MSGSEDCTTSEADDFRALDFKSSILTGSLADNLADAAPWGCYEMEGSEWNKRHKERKAIHPHFQQRSRPNGCHESSAQL